MAVTHREIIFLKKLASATRGNKGVKAMSRAHVNIQGLMALELVEWQGSALRVTQTGRAFLKRKEIEGLSSGAGEEGPSDNVFRSQHQLEQITVRQVEGRRQHVKLNVAESPLGWLRVRKDRNGKPFISDVQYEAGERFRTDFEMASMGARVTARWDGLRANGRYGWAKEGVDPTTAQISARKRIHNALNALGADLSDIVVRVCCFLEKMEDAERGLGWPVRSGKLVLAIALDRLAEHYHKK